MRHRPPRSVAAVLAVLFACLPGRLASQERRGAGVVVTCNDGQVFAGELIAVKTASLVVLPSSRQAESIDLADISTIRIRGKSKAGLGILIGFGLGALLGTAAYRAIDDSPTGKEGVGAAFRTGLLGAASGLLIGAVARRDKLVRIKGESGASLDKIMALLRAKARIPG